LSILLEVMMSGDFQGLYRQERIGIGCKESLAKEGVTTDTPSSEPGVTITPDDHVGVALSGGGIRSVTFNLCLLHGLDDMGLLGRLHYLSTVSGGGYIGGVIEATFGAIATKMIG
jgi:hypothetical protein